MSADSFPKSSVLNDEYYAYRDPAWILRNDTHYLLLYKSAPLQNMHFKLTWVPSCLLQLINGERTVRELAAAFKVIFDLESYSLAKKLVESVVYNLNSTEPVIRFMPIPRPDDIHDRRDYFIQPENYSPNGYRLRQPKNITLMPTNRCQTDCIYCSADRHDRLASQELPIRRWLTLVDEIAYLKIGQVEITGGDPLVRRDIVELYESLMQNQIYFFVSTKCRVTSEFARRLKSGGFDEHLPTGARRQFQLSIDSHRPETLSKMTGNANYFEIAKRNIEVFQENGIRPTIKTVMTPYNYEDIESMLCFYSALGVNTFNFVLYSRSYFKHGDDLFLNAEQKRSLAEFFKGARFDQFRRLDVTYQDDFGDRDDTDRRLTPESWRKRASCTGGFSSLTVIYNGDVLLCEQMPQTDEFVFGNIAESPLTEIWNSEKIADFIYAKREKFAGTVCADCDEFDLCHYEKGYCYRDSLFNYGTVCDAPPNCPKQSRPAKRLV